MTLYSESIVSTRGGTSVIESAELFVRVDRRTDGWHKMFSHGRKKSSCTKHFPLGRTRPTLRRTAVTHSSHKFWTPVAPDASSAEPRSLSHLHASLKYWMKNKNALYRAFVYLPPSYSWKMMNWPDEVLITLGESVMYPSHTRTFSRLPCGSQTGRHQTGENFQPKAPPQKTTAFWTFLKPSL